MGPSLQDLRNDGEKLNSVVRDMGSHRRWQDGGRYETPFDLLKQEDQGPM